MKNIIIAPDSFKESLSAVDVADAIEKGLFNVQPNWHTQKIPLADGGEGTLAIIEQYVSCQRKSSLVCNAIAQPINAYFLLSQHNIAYIEVAQSVGLAQLPEELRNPLESTSYGVGQQISQALEANITEIVLTFGGSACNDAGAGLLQALGAKYFDAKKQLLKAVGGNLIDIHTVDLSELDIRLQSIKFTLLTDVTNPLLGSEGASMVFCPQKGASAKEVIQLEENICHFSQLLENKFNKDISTISGCGAAGGIPASLLATTDAKIQSGIDYLMSLTHFNQHLSQADLVITGEGKIDNQTINGKVISGIIELAKRHKVPVIALAGSIDAKSDLTLLSKKGLTAVFSICPSPTDIPTALKNTAFNLEYTANNIARLFTTL